MKPPIRLLSLPVAVLTAGALTAQTWQLIDDFDDDVNGDNFSQWEITYSQGNVIGYLPEFEEGDETYLELQYFNPEDPNDAGLNLETGGYGKINQFGTAHAVAPVPVVPAVGSSTLYFQYYQDGGSNEFHFGLTTLPKVGPVDKDGNPIPIVEPVTYLYSQPSIWDHHALLFYSKYDNQWVFRDSNKYLTNTELQIESYTWYEMWIVSHNREGAEFGPNGDTYELWIKGGEFTTPTQVMVPPRDAVDGDGNPLPYRPWANWRNPSEDTFTYVMFSSQTGAPDSPSDGDPHVIDDLYMIEGVAVETPPGVTVPSSPENWNGYLVETDGTNKWVQTGEGFIGTLSLPLGWPDVDTSWVYSHLLKDWIWADEDLLEDEGAGWVYIRK